MDFDEPIRVLTEFIAHHPMSIPCTKIPEPPLPFPLLLIAFERFRIHNHVLETKITGDRIVPIHKSTFIKAIGVTENPKGFNVLEQSTEEFQQFLNHIGYNQEYKSKEFKKSDVSGL